MSDTKAKDIIARHERLKSDRTNIDSVVQEIYELCQPRKAQIITQKATGDTSDADAIFDPTLGDANMTLSAGLMTSTTPSSDRWHFFNAPAWKRAQLDGSDAADDWYQRCSEISAMELAASNFYTAIQEFHLDRNLAGTAAIFVDEGRNKTLVFKTLPYGSYTFAEDSDGEVDTLNREFELSARAAYQKWGDKLGKKVREAALAENRKDQDKPFTFIQSVYPREEAERNAKLRDAGNKPWASCYVGKDDENVIEEGGYDERPFVVSRFLKWSGDIWGWGPGFDTLGLVRGLNFKQEHLQVLVEKAANPPILRPASLIGRIDSRAAGETMYNDEGGELALPRTWQTIGQFNLQSLKEDIDADQRMVRRMFFNDLFQMFADVEAGKMTATEATLRNSEKLNTFSPAFKSLTTEALGPLLLRVFGLLFRGGLFPPPPDELLEVGARGTTLPIPEVQYQSRMALALKLLENSALVQTVEILGPIAQMDPTMLDNFNFDQLAPDVARNLMLPARWIRPRDEVAVIRQQRAQAQQAMAGVEAAQGVARAAKDVSGASPEVQRALLGGNNR